MLMTAPQSSLLPPEVIVDAARRAARSIPPLWPLASSVAVNPFLGQTNEPLATASARLRHMAGIALTMPRTWFSERLRSGEITDEDLRNAFEAAPAGFRPSSVDELKRAAQCRRDAPQALPTVGDLARNLTGIDWPRIIDDRIGHWASSYFDQGQALWSSPDAPTAYSAWRSAATLDLVPEINGLTGFARTVAEAPTEAEDALFEWVSALEVPEAALESYFHRLLITLGGWSQVARYKLWQAELSRASDTTVIDLLAIRASYEAALLRKYGAKLVAQWQAARTTYAEPVVATMDDSIDAILQEAAERAAQRRLQITLGRSSAISKNKDRPRLQMAFCIDVRSEVFRRALESLSGDIQTLGFAGFFGLGIGHRRFGSDVLEARLPVLLSPAVFTCSPATTTALQKRETRTRIAARAKRAWGRFKLAAISSFAFVEAAGPIYVAKLLRDGLALKRPTTPEEPAPQPVIDLDRQTRVEMAASVLRAMSLTEDFARLVLLIGHGANVVNNPHASALHCGACGGYSGEVNARLLATLLNEADVRAGLADLGISIPQDTLFLAALHDTTTDDVTVYAADHNPISHADDLARATQWLKSASALARAERSLRLPRAVGARDIVRRSRDWAELRPEWALAGNQAFIAAPRARTEGLDLAGRAFLHEYDWRRDDGFRVLELIMTAPVVVASWINLQYYGSTVAPQVFGAGNKLLHNVTGGIGVIEGNGGLLRSGLPWQSIHDGERLVHEPLRLAVMIEAPRAAITDILDRHPDVRALFDNRWLHLFALDDDGRMAFRYTGNLTWETCSPHAEKLAPNTTAVQPSAEEDHRSISGDAELTSEERKTICQ